MTEKEAAKKTGSKKIEVKVQNTAKAKTASVREEKQVALPSFGAEKTETTGETDPFFTHKVILLVAIAAMLLFNQLQIGTVSALSGVSIPLSISSGSGNTFSFSGGDVDLSDVNVAEIKSTAQGIAALFPVGDIKTTDDAITVMIPTGTPEYGEAMGVSFDDPVAALSKLAKAYSALKEMAKKDDEVWQRYLSLAAAPTGISCEFCCGIGAQGVDSSGELRCGCSHNPAVQSVTMWLMLNTEYSDAEILKEVYKWKSIWFPRDMVSLSLQIAGGDTSVLEDLPGMVGGC